MSKLDRSKEQIAYLKLWLGILIVTAISLMGWLITHFDTENHFLIFGAVTVLVSIFVGCWILHNKIEYKITQLEDMMEIFISLLLVVAGLFITYLAIDATRKA